MQTHLENRTTRQLSPLILFGPLPPPTNGHTLAFRMLVEACRARGIACDVVNFSETGSTPTFAQRNAQRLIDYVSILGRYVRALHRNPGGVVYITLNQAVNGVLRDLLLISLAKLFGHRVVVHLHGGCYDQVLSLLPDLVRKTAVKALAACEAIILLSCRLESMFHRFPQLLRLVRVVPNGLPMKPPNDIQPKTINRGQPVKILFLSHFIETKGWLELLEAIEILTRDHGLRIDATFCGEFIHSPSDTRFNSAEAAQHFFEEYRRKLTPHAHIIWHKIVHGKEKEDILRHAHFLVLPTRYPNEGQPLVLIEGLAFGCVLIGTNYRALGDMIRPAETGVLTSPEPRALAQHIARLANQPEEFQQLSTGALQLFKSEFTPEQHIDRLLSVLSSVKPNRTRPLIRIHHEKHV